MPMMIGEIGEIGEISDLPITLHIHTPFIAIHKYKEKVTWFGGVEMVGNNRRITDFTDSKNRRALIDCSPNPKGWAKTLQPPVARRKVR